MPALPAGRCIRTPAGVLYTRTDNGEIIAAGYSIKGWEFRPADFKMLPSIHQLHHTPFISNFDKPKQLGLSF
jgi:hypothetical protein